MGLEENNVFPHIFAETQCFPINWEYLPLLPKLHSLTQQIQLILGVGGVNIFNNKMDFHLYLAIFAELRSSYETKLCHIRARARVTVLLWEWAFDD